MNKVKTEDAVGMILCHDMTQIIPGEFKGAAFKKGHVVEASDIPKLLSMGKDYIYVWEERQGLVHENEAGKRLARAINRGAFQETEPKEGKVDLIARENGLLRIDVLRITEVNLLGEIAISTLPNFSHVSAGQKVAGMRVIPLAISEEKMFRAEKALASLDAVMEVRPFKIRKAGLIVTGNEVYYGRIQDMFTPKIEAKLILLGVDISEKTYLPDAPREITAEILRQVELGVEIVLVTGGMSVDPDDATPGAIKNTGARVVSYGTPIFPGAMFMLAYLHGFPVLGLPGCVMHSPATVFDKFLPRILAGEDITAQEIAASGVGGLCRDCEECHFPNCSFGVS